MEIVEGGESGGESSERSTQPATAELGFTSSKAANQTTGGRNRVEARRLRVQRIIVDIKGTLAAARAMPAYPSDRIGSSSCGSRHALPCSSARRNHAGHCRGHALHQQQDQHSELAQDRHCQEKITSSTEGEQPVVLLTYRICPFDGSHFARLHEVRSSTNGSQVYG